MDWWGRFWGGKKWSLAGLTPILTGDRLWIAVGAVALLGVILIIAVCWLAHWMKDENEVEIETPILTVRRGSKRAKKFEKDSEKAEEQKDDAKT
jgi:hypothetical protein